MQSYNSIWKRERAKKWESTSQNLRKYLGSTKQQKVRWKWNGLCSDFRSDQNNETSRNSLTIGNAKPRCSFKLWNTHDFHRFRRRPLCIALFTAFMCSERFCMQRIFRSKKKINHLCRLHLCIVKTLISHYSVCRCGYLASSTTAKFGSLQRWTTKFGVVSFLIKTRQHSRTCKPFREF